jgi:hypothetical protein
MTFREQLLAAAAAVHLIELFDGLIKGLDVYANCPFLAQEAAQHGARNQA